MIPMYQGTADEAREKGELDLWQQSWRENMRCRKAIEAAIKRHFDGMHLGHDIHLPIIENFGLDRVNYVLAVTLAYKDLDGRFSLANRNWAESLGIQIDDDHIYEYVVNSHSAVLDGFIDMVRKYNEQNMNESAEESPYEDSENIKQITTDDLRHMKGSEGLILQGCGGSLREWVDGINTELTEAGILLNGTKFSEVSAFKNDNVTCLLFPFNEDVKLDMGKLAMWRLRTHEAFGGTWLSDYIPNRLEDPEDDLPEYDDDPDEDDGIIMT